MATKSKRIKDKLLMEAYTPVEADSDGYSDGVDFAAVVGNKRFHSFQVWREKDGGRPTYVYGLTLTQIEAIRVKANEGLSIQIAELQAQLEAARKAISEIEKQAFDNRTTFKQKIEQLHHDNQWLTHELKPVLQKKTNDSVLNSGKSVRTISIPMGGAPGYSRKPKRR
jgi:hypothetical protein